MAKLPIASAQEIMVKIEPERNIFTLINTFEVEPTNQQIVANLLEDATEKLIKQLPGFVSASIHQSFDGKYVTNYAQWESEIHFRSMTKNLEMQAHMKEVQALTLSTLPVFYRVTYVGEAES